MRILGIDPGPTQSAFVLYDVEGKEIIYKTLQRNYECEYILFAENLLRGKIQAHCIIEMPQCFGMAVGKTVLETCKQVGRFEALADQLGLKNSLIYRSDVKMHLCKSMKAKDANIRQAVMDRFGSSREKAIGTKKKPGPLYGISKDLWSALAICITYAETKAES